MDPNEERLKKFLERKGIQAEHFHFEDSCHSVKEAAKAANISADEIIKNICMISPEGEIFVAIARGKDGISISRVEEASGIKKIRVATPQEILEKTSYPCGGVPSFGYSAKFFIDFKVMEKEKIYTGGGSENSLIKISAKDMQKANNGKIARIRN